MPQKVGLITGASRGLGLALARALGERGWRLILDARGGSELEQATRRIEPTPEVIPGDVADDRHRAELFAAVERLGRLDLLVNNASLLGPSPRPDLSAHPIEDLESIYRVNVLAPVALAQRALPMLQASTGALINITSDAASEPYQGWGGYGSSKAALEYISGVLALEHPEVRIYVVDPGDMNTQMQQEAFPDEDISDRPPPEESVPGLLRLIEGDLPSGRYEARSLVAAR